MCIPCLSDEARKSENLNIENTQTQTFSPKPKLSLAPRDVQEHLRVEVVLLDRISGSQGLRVEAAESGRSSGVNSRFRAFCSLKGSGLGLHGTLCLRGLRPVQNSGPLGAGRNCKDPSLSNPCFSERIAQAHELRSWGSQATCKRGRGAASHRTSHSPSPRWTCRSLVDRTSSAPRLIFMIPTRPVRHPDLRFRFQGVHQDDSEKLADLLEPYKNNL